MEKDFSVSGREKFLFETFKTRLEDGPLSMFTFARWTLLERVIWKFKPDNTYCYLDGFDFDTFTEFDNGFFGVGRSWHFPDVDAPGDIPIAMAIEFDEAQACVKRSVFWIGRIAAEYISPPDTTCLSFFDLFLPGQNIGAEWQPAFRRTSVGWSIDNEFDLSTFLVPNKEKGDL